MKRKMFFMGTLALVLAGVTFWSCQKNEELMDAEDGVMLKKGKMAAMETGDAIFNLPTNPICFDEEITIEFFVGNDEINCGLVRVDILKPSGIGASWNDEKEIWENAWTVKILDDENPVDGKVSYTFKPDEIGEYKFRGTSAEENDRGDKCGVKIDGFVESEILLIENCNECTNWQTESAFAGEAIGGGNKGWWFSYDGDGVETIWAGQNINVGTVEYISGGEMVITLKDGWELNPIKLNKETGEETENTEPVKIQGYTTLPSDRPAAGQFTTYKGTELTPEVDEYAFYVIHLDVRKCAD